MYMNGGADGCLPWAVQGATSCRSSRSASATTQESAGTVTIALCRRPTLDIPSLGGKAAALVHSLAWKHALIEGNNPLAPTCECTHIPVMRSSHRPRP